MTCNGEWYIQKPKGKYIQHWKMRGQKKTFTSFFISDIIGEEIVVDKNVKEHDDSVHETLEEIEGNSLILGPGPWNKANSRIHENVFGQQLFH